MQMLQNNISPQRRSFFGIPILVLGLLLSGFCFVEAMPKQEQVSQPFAHSRIDRFRTKNIQDIRVGDRVLADNPDVESTDETQVDPTTWRKVVLQAEDRWADGTLDVINVETLQPLEWIEAFGARVGSTVPIPLDLVEMGLPKGLKSKVIAIDPCPKVVPGPGRVVLTTVNHLNRAVMELAIRDINGRIETVRPTAPHKFYRSGDNIWTPAADLEPGATLQDAYKQPVTLMSMRPIPGTHVVYNMTIEGEHVYNVSVFGVLVHNNCPDAPKGKGARQKGQRMTSQDDALQQLEEIEEAQRRVRQGKSKQIIDSIEKSKQRAKNRLKEIANDPDLLDDLD